MVSFPETTAASSSKRSTNLDLKCCCDETRRCGVFWRPPTVWITPLDCKQLSSTAETNGSQIHHYILVNPNAAITSQPCFYSTHWVCQVWLILIWRQISTTLTEVPAPQFMFHRLIWSRSSKFYQSVLDAESICCGGLVQKQLETVMTSDGDDENSSHNVQTTPTPLSDARDGNISPGGDVICYKWPYCARSEILGRSNAAVWEMICRTSITDLAGSCANANCPNYSSGEFVDFLVVTSGMAPFLPQWVVWPICTVWQDTAAGLPEEIRFQKALCTTKLNGILSTRAHGSAGEHCIPFYGHSWTVIVLFLKKPSEMKPFHNFEMDNRSRKLYILDHEPQQPCVGAQFPVDSSHCTCHGIMRYVSVFLHCSIPIGGQGQGAGAYPSCIWAKAWMSRQLNSQGPMWAFEGFATLLKGTSVVLWRCPGTFPNTRTSALFCLYQGFNWEPKLYNRANVFIHLMVSFNENNIMGWTLWGDTLPFFFFHWRHF